MILLPLLPVVLLLLKVRLESSDFQLCVVRGLALAPVGPQV